MLPAAKEIGEVTVDEIEPLHLLDVGAGGKGLFGAGKDDGADGPVGVEGLQRGIELAHQHRIQRIERLRPVERDQAHAALRFDQQRLVTHSRLLHALSED